MTPTAAAALAAAKAADIAYVAATIVAVHNERGTRCVVYNLFAETVTDLEGDGYTVTDNTVDGVVYYTIDWSVPV